MCGICGFVSRRNISRKTLKSMNDFMMHRGPDDSGELVFEGKSGYHVGLAHRRLSILDLSELGHQPMVSADGRLIVVFNGEIYNFKELKRTCKTYAYHSGCDTEVILAAYETWGEDCVRHLNGMFAFAVYDREKGDLFLARDRIGKKPLYYWNDKKSQSIVFASELKPIMHCPGFERRIDTEVISGYLYQQYINAPDTIFCDVRKMEPGSVLKFHNGEIVTYKYWDVINVYKHCQAHPIASYDEAKHELKQMMVNSVTSRMAADVPVGTLLSGGYDSSLVTAIAQKALGAEKVKTFSIGFEEEDFNEAKFARQIADYLGTKHMEVYCTWEELLLLLEDMQYFYDEPFADPSLIPTMAVSKLAREHVTVCLSGDGGDEFFCGYGYYGQVAAAQKLDFLGWLAHKIGQVSDLESRYPLAVKVISQNRNRYYKTQIKSKTYEDCVTKMVAAKNTSSVKYNEEQYLDVKNWQIRRMLLDMDTYLSSGILTKVDRASMRYSLECRCPILDYKIMEFSFRLPQRFKYYKGNGKRILKDITHEYIPKEIMDRPKMGFNIPLDKWMRNVLKSRIRAYADKDYLNRQGIFDPGYCNRIINFYLDNGNVGNHSGQNYQNICWNFFVFQMWYERWIQKNA